MSQFTNDGEYDEQAAVKAAMALSMVTVQEDDVRRQQRWGIIAPSASSSAALEAAGPAPLNPLTARLSAPASIPMKRPSSQSNLLQNQKSQPAPKSSPPSGSIARPRPQSNKPYPGGKDGGLALTRPPLSAGRPQLPVSDDNGSIPPPLPSVGPNARSSQVLGTSEVPALPKSPRTSRVDHPPLANRNSENSLKDMLDIFDAEPLITLSPPLISSDDFDISALDPFSTKPYQSQGRQMDITGMTLPAYTEPPNKGISIRNPMFDLQNLSGKSSPTFEQSSSNKQLALSGLPLGGAVGQSAAAAGLPVGCSSGAIMGRPPPSIRLAAQPPLTPQPAMGIYPQLTNNPFNISTSSSSVSSPSSVPDGVPSSSSSSSALSTGSGTRMSNATSGSGDLMEFTGHFEEDPSHEFLSLEMFDPLYSPVPLMERDAESYETLMTATNDHLVSTNGDELIDALDAQSLSAEPRERSESNTSHGELQDPFEMSALTAALEKKRAQHAKEQAKRDAILRPKEGERPKVVETKKKGHVRRNSHLARGQVGVTSQSIPQE